MPKKTNKELEKSFKEHLQLAKAREWIKEPYKDSATWCEKVDKMPAKQVYGIYNTFIKAIRNPKPKQVLEMITIFDLLREGDDDKCIDGEQ